MTHAINPTQQYKLIVYVPLSHADKVRDAMGKAGGGVIGHYGFCSFSTMGTGRYKPLDGANPFIGEIGVLEQVAEERIEITVTELTIKAVISAMKAVHPYDEIAYDVYELVTGF